MGRSPRAFVAAALGVLVLAPACSLGDKQDQAERIIASVERLADHGPRAGEGRIEFRVESMPGPQIDADTPPPSAPAAAPAPSLTYALVLDADAGRAELRPAPDIDPLVVFAAPFVYVRRSGVGSSRPWAALDFGELDRVEKPSLEQALSGFASGTAGLIDPNLVVGLVAGALTGSIETRGPTEVGGIAAERYELNLSVDKAESELGLDEPERDVRRRMLTAIGMTDDVVPADVWLGDDGSLIQVEVRFPLRPAPRVRLATVYRVRLDRDAVSPRLPTARSVLTVESPAELLRGLRGGS